MSVVEAQLELQWFPRETRFRLERFFNRTLRQASAELEFPLQISHYDNRFLALQIHDPNTNATWIVNCKSASEVFQTVNQAIQGETDKAPDFFVRPRRRIQRRRKSSSIAGPGFQRSNHLESSPLLVLRLWQASRQRRKDRHIYAEQIQCSCDAMQSQLVLNQGHDFTGDVECDKVV